MVNWINHYHRWYTLIEVDPKRLLQVADNTKSGFEPEKQKLDLLLEGFIDGEIDAPIVGRSYEGISFVDGRHRVTLAARFRLPAIKIAVLPSEKSYIEGILKS